MKTIKDYISENKKNNFGLTTKKIQGVKYVKASTCDPDEFDDEDDGYIDDLDNINIDIKSSKWSKTIIEDEVTCFWTPDSNCIVYYYNEDENKSNKRWYVTFVEMDSKEFYEGMFLSFWSLDSSYELEPEDFYTFKTNLK